MIKSGERRRRRAKLSCEANQQMIEAEHALFVALRLAGHRGPSNDGQPLLRQLATIVSAVAHPRRRNQAACLTRSAGADRQPIQPPPRTSSSRKNTAAWPGATPRRGVQRDVRPSPSRGRSRWRGGRGRGGGSAPRSASGPLGGAAAQPAHVGHPHLAPAQQAARADVHLAGGRSRCAARSAAAPPPTAGRPLRWPTVKWWVPACSPSTWPLSSTISPGRPGAAARLDEGPVVAVGDEADLLRVGLVPVGQPQPPGVARAPRSLVMSPSGNRTNGSSSGRTANRK